MEWFAGKCKAAGELAPRSLRPRLTAGKMVACTLKVLFTSQGSRKLKRATCAVMWMLYWSVVVYQSIYIPSLTYGTKLWIVTKRMRLRIQLGKRSV